MKSAHLFAVVVLVFGAGFGCAAPKQNTPASAPEQEVAAAADSDGDLIPDRTDACIEEVEDVDGFEDDDGCPDPDNDGDAILDVDDQCPLEAEIYNGREDEDGCPDRKRYPDGWREHSEIRIDQKVFFEVGEADVPAASDAFLDELARVLLVNPQILEVRIEGHADTSDAAPKRMEISRKRAESVRKELLERGVEAGRLTLDHHGDSEPLCDPVKAAAKDLSAAECDARNRRVEFKVMRLKLSDGTIVEQHK